MSETLMQKPTVPTVWVEITRNSGVLRRGAKHLVDFGTAARWCKRALIARMIAPPDPSDPSIATHAAGVDPLQQFNEDELREMVQHQGITGADEMSRAELMDAMRKLERGEPVTAPKRKRSSS